MLMKQEVEKKPYLCLLVKGYGTCPARCGAEGPCAAFQTASWIAAPGELWWSEHFHNRWRPASREEDPENRTRAASQSYWSCQGNCTLSWFLFFSRAFLSGTHVAQENRLWQVVDKCVANPFLHSHIQDSQWETHSVNPLKYTASSPSN